MSVITKPNRHRAYIPVSASNNQGVDADVIVDRVSETGASRKAFSKVMASSNWQAPKHVSHTLMQSCLTHHDTTCMEHELSPVMTLHEAKKASHPCSDTRVIHASFLQAFTKLLGLKLVEPSSIDPETLFTEKFPTYTPPLSNIEVKLAICIQSIELGLHMVWGDLNLQIHFKYYGLFTRTAFCAIRV